jgi:hypothetical protein
MGIRVSPENDYLNGTVMSDYLIGTYWNHVNPHYLLSILVWVNSDHEPFTTIMVTININGH